MWIGKPIALFIYIMVGLSIQIYYKLSDCLCVGLCVTELLPNEGSNRNKWGIKLKVSLPGMSARIFFTD